MYLYVAPRISSKKNGNALKIGQTYIYVYIYIYIYIDCDNFWILLLFFFLFASTVCHVHSLSVLPMRQGPLTFLFAPFFILAFLLLQRVCADDISLLEPRNHSTHYAGSDLTIHYKGIYSFNSSMDVLYTHAKGSAGQWILMAWHRSVRLLSRSQIQEQAT